MGLRDLLPSANKGDQNDAGYQDGEDEEGEDGDDGDDGQDEEEGEDASGEQDASDGVPPPKPKTMRQRQQLGPGVGRDKRFVVPLVTGEATVVSNVIAGLAAEGSTYQRDQQLVGVRLDDDGRSTIYKLTTNNIRETITLACRLVTCAKKPANAHPPRWLPGQVHDRGRYPGIQPLKGVVGAPTLRPDGTVISKVGYDSSTGLYYAPTHQFPAMPEPTAAAARAAAIYLLYVFVDFPFKSDADRAAVLALVLTMVGRTLIDGPVPGYLVSGNGPAVGKGKVVETACAIATGALPAAMPEADDKETIRKRITAIAEEDARIMLFDNATAFGGPTLDALLTSRRWQDRPVGARRTINLPWRTVVAITGNGVRLQGDSSRRILPIRLETQDPNPEARTNFKHDLPAWALRHHPDLYVAALTILRAALATPDVQMKGSWGSYDEWCQVIRRAVIFSFGVDPLGTREAATNADEELGALKALLSILAANGPQTASAMIKKATATDVMADAALCEALSTMAANRDGRLYPRGVGVALKKHVDRVVKVDETKAHRLRCSSDSNVTHWSCDAGEVSATGITWAPAKPVDSSGTQKSGGKSDDGLPF